MDQLKKFLKIWNFQKKPRRSPQTRGLSYSPGVSIPSQQASVVSKNPFTGTSSLPPLFAVTSLSHTTSSSSYERQSAKSWDVQIQQDQLSPHLTFQQDIRSHTNRLPLDGGDGDDDDDVKYLLNAVEELQLTSFSSPAERSVRQKLPRFARSMSLAANMFTDTKGLKPGQQGYFNEALQDVQRLLNCLENNSTSGVGEDTGLNLISTSSIRDLQQEISMVAWTNRLTRHFLAYQAQKINGSDIRISIDKRQFKSLTGETFEKVETNIFFIHESDSLALGSPNGKGGVLHMRMLHQSRERYTPSLSVSLTVFQRILFINGADDILNAASSGDLEKIQNRCSKGEWSLRCCDEDGQSTLLYAMHGVFRNSDPVAKEKCMRVVELIVNEAPDVCFAVEDIRFPIVYCLFFLVSRTHTSSADREDGYSFADSILRHLISAGCDFSDTSLIACLILGSLDNARTLLNNDTFYVDIDDIFIALFLRSAGNPDINMPKTEAVGLPSKLGILLNRLKNNTGGRPIRAHHGIHILLTSRGVISFNNLVELLVIMIDATGGIYHPTASKVGSFGQFCITAHLSGNHQQWYEALAKCHYRYTRFQAVSWEAKHSGVDFEDYLWYLLCADALRESFKEQPSKSHDDLESVTRQLLNAGNVSLSSAEALGIPRVQVDRAKPFATVFHR
ncbi:hypothetical protein TWF481_004248 [Arthrobotrys musiformis]|uniref:Uncharacterized protein n=1 Tax=Arthrobotrys musiformis TaxID=47236 RepID=A0AAV9WL31_9PEZI